MKLVAYHKFKFDILLNIYAYGSFNSLKSKVV